MTTAAFPLTAAPVRAATALACAVRLVDRRTGQTHRINGSPLVLSTRNPAAAVVDLREGRDPAFWEAGIEPIEAAERE